MMEIKSVNQNGVSKVSDTLKIKYSLSVKGEEVKSFTGQIVNDEDTCIGFCNASNNGVVGFSLSEDNGLTGEEVRAVSAKFIDDVVTTLGL